MYPNSAVQHAFLKEDWNIGLSQAMEVFFLLECNKTNKCCEDLKRK